MKGTKTLLYAAALAVLTLVSTAHAQIAFRSSSSAFIAGGGGTPVAPGLRSSAWASIKPGATRFYPQTPAPTVTPTIRGSWPDGGTTCCASGSTVGNNYQPLTLETFHAPPGTAEVCTAVNRIRTTVNPGHVMVTLMISGPLPVDQTISGTMNWVIATYESANNQNAITQFILPEIVWSTGSGPLIIRVTMTCPGFTVVRIRFTCVQTSAVPGGA